MHADALTHGRSSFQTRAVHPFPEEEPHPRARELAESMRDIAALGQGVSFKDLIHAGYTSADILEHHRAAERHAATLAEKRIDTPPDLMADMIAKARVPMPNDPPMPQHVGETQALYLAWGHYCAARAALLMDPWSGQRERCCEMLMDYLNKLPLFPRERKAILRAASETMNRIVSAEGREGDRPSRLMARPAGAPGGAAAGTAREAFTR